MVVEGLDYFSAPPFFSLRNQMIIVRFSLPLDGCQATTDQTSGSSSEGKRSDMKRN